MNLGDIVGSLAQSGGQDAMRYAAGRIGRIIGPIASKGLNIADEYGGNQLARVGGHLGGPKGARIGRVLGRVGAAKVGEGAALGVGFEGAKEAATLLSQAKGGAKEVVQTGVEMAGQSQWSSDKHPRQKDGEFAAKYTGVGSLRKGIGSALAHGIDFAADKTGGNIGAGAGRIVGHLRGMQIVDKTPFVGFAAGKIANDFADEGSRIGRKIGTDTTKIAAGVGAGLAAIEGAKTLYRVGMNRFANQAHHTPVVATSAVPTPPAAKAAAPVKQSVYSQLSPEDRVAHKAEMDRVLGDIKTGKMTLSSGELISNPKQAYAIARSVADRKFDPSKHPRGHGGEFAEKYDAAVKLLKGAAWNAQRMQSWKSSLGTHGINPVKGAWTPSKAAKSRLGITVNIPKTGAAATPKAPAAPATPRSVPGVGPLKTA